MSTTATSTRSARRDANARWQKFYARRKRGRICLTIEADEILVDVLVAEELLSENLRDDKGAIQEATTKLIEIILNDGEKIK
jgi:hypothetical protein